MKAKYDSICFRPIKKEHIDAAIKTSEFAEVIGAISTNRTIQDLLNFLDEVRDTCKDNGGNVYVILNFEERL